MSHIRLIISDIDGTILNDHHQIDPQLAALIPDLKRENHSFRTGLCSLSKRDGSHRQRTRHRRLPHGLLQWCLDPKGRAGSVSSILWTRRRPGTLSTGPTNTSLKFRSTSIVEKTG